MNQHKLKVFCGQIKFLHAFFDGYCDEVVSVFIEQVNKIDMNIIVKTDLTGEETEHHIKRAFKKSPMGSALHYTVKLL